MLLRQMLYRCELRFLTVIAKHWLRLNKIPDYEELIRMLCTRMLDAAVLKQLLDSSKGSQFIPAFDRLIKNKGQEPTESFEETFGPFRIAGMDRIIREKRWETPVSVTEELFYHGLIFRENRLVNGEPKECYIMPEDLGIILKRLLPEDFSVDIPKPPFIIRPAIPSETVLTKPVNNDLPDLVSLAAALLRDDRSLEFPGANLSEEAVSFIRMLVSECFFSNKDQPEPSESIRSFLIHNRTSAIIDLIRSWRTSETYDELAETKELQIIKAPEFDRRKPREKTIQILSALAPETWWSLNGFVSSVKKNEPLFLRSSIGENRGQISDTEGNDLSGIGSWYQLEGAYLRFLLLGPLCWLGLVQIAYADKTGMEAAAFRITQNTSFLLREAAEEHTSEEILLKPNLEQEAPGISSDGAISCSSKVPRYFRYMAARYCKIESIRGGNTVFRITPDSLSYAEGKGLEKSSFLNMLQRFSKGKVPPALAHLLSSEKNNSLPATIYSATILTIPNGEILSELLETPRLEKWIRQQINPTSLLIDSKGINEIRRFLMEREIFVDIQV